MFHDGNCGSSDTILYDFSRENGDTLFQCNEIVGAETTYISSVDSVLVSDSWRKRFNLNINSSLIEGIGSTGGLIGTWNGWIGGYYSLKCFSLNGTSLFPDTTCDSYTEVNDKDNYLKTEVQIAPNPIEKISNISVKLYKPSTIEINLFDLIGVEKNIFQGQLNAGLNTLTINLSELNSGLYQLQIVNRTEIYCINKLIEIIH